MNEAAEVASDVPAILLLTLWWAFLGTMDFLFSPRDRGMAGKPDAGSHAAESRNDADPLLASLVVLDPAFDREAFLAGACRAYEDILCAYAGGDLEAMRPLLSPDVLADFARDMAERQNRDETLDLTFVDMERAGIVDVRVDAAGVEVDVSFRAGIVRAELSSAGDVLRGDPAAVVATADLWTFSRPLDGRGPGWTLAATDIAPAGG